jgi:FkbM family methyltransferase
VASQNALNEGMFMNTGNSAFLMALLGEVMANMNNWYGSENWDPERFGPYQSSFANEAVSKFNHLFSGRVAIVPLASNPWQIENVSGIRDSLEGLQSLYELLANEASKQTLVKVLTYRLMGHKKVKLPHNTDSYWSQRAAVNSLIKGNDSISVKFPKLTLNHLALEKIGYPIELYFAPSGVMAAFILKQYEYQKIKPEVRAEAGDYVIDGGGCWGDTALYFAHTVGAEGRVFSFEFAPDSLDVFQRNMALNAALSQRIEIVERALWSKSGEVIEYSPNGPGTSLAMHRQSTYEDPAQATTMSIDDFARERKLPRVDFIKMDIEGAELNALKGAEETIRSFKPKLAIAIYHRQADFIEIPEYLNKLGLGYRFYLDHFTIYGEETVLFAQPPS